MKRKWQSGLAGMVAVAMGCAANALAADIYVDQSATGLPEDGSNWTQAYRSLATALAQKTGEVYVAQGTYAMANTDIKINNLYGGYPTQGAGARDPVANPTILDGGGANRVLTKTGAGRSILDGFVVRNGSVTNDGAGLLVSAASGGSVTILNCAFSNNAALTGGGAVKVGASTVNIFSNCTFFANSSSNDGGAVHSSPSSGITNTFTDCVFTTNSCWGNSAATRGGAMRIAGGLLQMTRCVFSNNWTGGSGGALSGGAAFDLSGGGNVFAGNSSAKDGGAIANSGTDPNAFSNCTFTANTAGTDGGAVYLSGASVTTFRNCAFITNTAPNSNGDGGAIYSTAGLLLELSNCAFSNNTCLANGGTIHFTGNIAATNTDFVGGSGLIGGAIYKGGGGFTTFGNCGFVANQASGTLGGGAMYVHNTATTNAFLNCTFFTNRASNASGPGGAVRVNHAGSVLSATNCIFWQNAAGGAGASIQSLGTLNIAYCDISMSAVSTAATNVGAGITNANPLFASESIPYDVHLKSLYGRWNPAAGQWVNDAVHSPCIDAGMPYNAGDPVTFFSKEPHPNGTRVNLGRYGNTAQASKSRGATGICLIVQ
jgi:predicted outer membrane repeat protein